MTDVSKQNAERRIKDLFVDSAFAGFLLFLGLTFNFVGHFIDILKTVFPARSGVITIGMGSPVPYLDSANSFMNSIPLTIVLFGLSLYATVIEGRKIWMEYFIHKK
jgi:hypothetical protein